ncbi:MAG: hypothetical protein K2H95_07010 [Bacteroidales bacterium]|nr:hypothetical protein [Bacteroidales bacterium]MDE6147438.1 hypothetical protein [Bacteroidales bacterium]
MIPSLQSAQVQTEFNVNCISNNPHTVGPFIDASPSSFYNLEISGYDLGSRRLDELASRVFDCDDNVQCINMIER